jgi:hypothetical protein
MDTQSIPLPPAQDGKSLVGLFKIRRYETYDEIHLATNIQLGVIHTINETFQFQAINSSTPEPVRDSYEACWFDVLVLIAKDKYLAIELAVLAHKSTVNRATPRIVESLGGF